MFFAIGKPGERARMVLRETDKAEAEVQLQAGECAAPVDAPGAWIMAADGRGATRMPISLDAQWHLIRAERWRLLVETDKHIMSDRPMAPELREAWIAYRQALRDITKQPDPANIVWPVSPEGAST